MIDNNSRNELVLKFKELSLVHKKVLELIVDELSPKSIVINVFKVKNGKHDAWILVTEEKLMIFWRMKLFFLKFPTIQEFEFSQINKIENREDCNLYIHASSDENCDDDNYEEGMFKFQNFVECEELNVFLSKNASRRM